MLFQKENKQTFETTGISLVGSCVGVCLLFGISFEVKAALPEVSPEHLIQPRWIVEARQELQAEQKRLEQRLKQAKTKSNQPSQQAQQIPSRSLASQGSHSSKKTLKPKRELGSFNATSKNDRVVAPKENASYFNDLNYGLPKKNETGNPLMDEDEAKVLRQNMSDMNRDYELKERYGLATQQDRIGFIDRMRGFGRWVMQKMFRNQLEKSTEKAQTNSVAIKQIQKAQETMTEVMQPNLNVATSEESDFHFKLGTAANIPRQEGRVWFQSDLVNGSLDVQFGPGFGFDPVSMNQFDPQNPNEAYRLTLSRELPIWSLHTGVSYGGTTGLLTTSLSKSLFNGLNLQLLNRQNVNATQQATLPPQGEQLFLLNYGLNF